MTVFSLAPKKKTENASSVRNPAELTLHKTYRDPHFCFRVSTNDQKVFDFLETYLDFRDTDKTYDPFFEITYRIRYCDRDTLEREEKAVYNGITYSDYEHLATMQERGAEVKMLMTTMEVDAEVFCLRRDLGIMDFVFLQPCRTFLACRDWLCVHGAHVQGESRDIIFMGPSGSGKSSLGYMLGTHEGYRLQSDDEVFIHSGRRENFCLPFPTRIGFKNKALEKRLVDSGQLTTVYGTKSRFRLPSSADHFGDIVARKTLLLVPHYDDKASTLTIDPADKEELFQEALSFIQDMCHLRHLERKNKEILFTLSTFIKRSSVYRLTYNDRLLGDLPAFIESIP